MSLDDAGPTVVASTLLQWLAKFGTLIFGLAAVGYLTRTLGPADYGRYASALVVQGFAVMIADWGLSIVTVRWMSADDASMDRILPVVMRGRMQAACATTVMGVLISYASVGRDQVAFAAIGVALIGVVPATAAGVLATVYQVRTRLHVVAGIELLVRMLAVTLMVVAAWAGGGPVAVAGATVVASIISVILLLRRLGTRPRWRARDAGLLVGLMRESIPIGLAVLINTIYFRIDVLILVGLRGFATTGIYTAAYRVMEAVLVLPSIFGQSLLPLLSRAASDAMRLTRTLNNGLRFILLVMVPIVCVGIAYAHGLMRLVGGNAFASSAGTLIVLLAAGLVSTVDILLGLAIIAANLQRRVIWLNVSGLLLNVLLNLVMIPRLGGTGAAYATLISESAVLVVALAVLHRAAAFRVATRELWLLGLAAALAVGVGASVLAVGPRLLAVSVSLVAFASAAFVFRLVTLADLEALAAKLPLSALRKGAP